MRSKCRNGRCRDNLPMADDSGNIEKSEEGGGGGGGESNHMADEVFHQSLSPDQTMEVTRNLF